MTESRSTVLLYNLDVVLAQSQKEMKYLYYEQMLIVRYLYNETLSEQTSLVYISSWQTAIQMGGEKKKKD